MTKYEFALLRKTLNSAIYIPFPISKRLGTASPRSSFGASGRRLY